MALMAAAVFSSCSSTGAGNQAAGGQTQVDKSLIGSGGAEGATDFFVESVSPNEEVPSSVSFPSIQVQFSKPVVALQKLGEPITKSDVVSITPKLNGVFRWYGTSLLSFDCSDALIPQKEYAITVNPDLKSADGTAISGPVCYTFHTEELKLKSVVPGYIEQKEKKMAVNPNDIPVEYAQNIALTFSNKVNAAVVTKYISVSDMKGKIYSYKASSVDEKTLLLKMDSLFPKDCEITVKMEAGAVPDENCWATSSVQSRTFHTLRPFELSHINGNTALSISFNHQIKSGSEKSVYAALSFSPKMEVSPENLEIHGNTIYISNIPVTFNDTYTVTLEPNSVVDIYDQSYGKEVSEEITVPDADSYASFRDSNFAVLESQFEPRRAFEFQNIGDDSSYTITPISGVTDSYKPGKEKTFELKITPETKNRRVIKVVDLKDFLEKTEGGYRGGLKFSSKCSYGLNEKKGRWISNEMYILSSNLGMTIHSAWNETVVLVTDLTTGAVVPDAKVSIKEVYGDSAKGSYIPSMFIGMGTVLASSSTDENGLAVLRFNSKDKSGYINYVEVKTHDDRLVMELPMWWGNRREFNAVSIEDGKLIDSTSGREISAKDLRKGESVTKIFSDRGLYRPGETMSFKVIDRSLVLGQYSTYTGPYEIEIREGYYYNAKVHATFKGETSSYGTASGEWTLPEDLKPGSYVIKYMRTDGSGCYSQDSFSVQFFERLRFQASAEIAPVTYYRGDSVTATIKASYLGGGSLAGGRVTADWTRSTTSFTPPGKEYAGYSFGPQEYDNYYKMAWDDDVEDEISYDNFHETSTENLSAEGTAHVGVSTGSEPKEGYPYAYSLQAQVSDAGNQMIATRASAIVHPASFYIGVSGVQNIKGVPKKGDKLSFNYLLASPDGSMPDDKLLSKDKKINWTLSRRTWEEVIMVNEYGYEYSDWRQVVVEESSGTLSSKKGTLSITPKEGGTYYLHLTTKDSSGRSVITDRSFYVTGSSSYRNYGDEMELKLIKDKNEYEVGDTAHVIFESPLEKGLYLVTVEREGIISEKVLNLKTSTYTLDLPIEDWYIPEVWVRVSSIIDRSQEPPSDYDTEDKGKPRRISAMTTLYVSTQNRRFDVDVKLDKKCYLPGESVKIDLTADKQGKPVANAELTLMAVDRGVLDLIGYRAGDPVSSFYGTWHFGNRTNSDDSRSKLMSPVTYDTYTLDAKTREMLYYRNEAKMMKMADMAKEAPMGVATASSRASTAFDDELMAECEEDCAAEGADEGGAEEPAMQVRKDFRATAVFLPNLVTDADGKVSTTFKLPDSLTEYVITVVGVKENDYAYKEDSLVVANPISVRDVETRILRPGDNGEAGVVITNIGDESEEVSVEFDVLSGLEKTDYVPAKGELVKLPGKASVSGDAKKSLVIKPGDTSTLMFRIDAQSAGWITLAFTVKSKSVNEVIYKRLEIEKPYIYETVTTVGQIDSDEKSAEEKIIFPAGTDDGRGTFFIQLDSTRLGALRSAVDYVFRYPYGCLEQRSSAVMPLIAFGDYISVFGMQSEVKDPASLVETEIGMWAELQRSDGGFPYWPDGKESSFAVSLRIGEILALAKEHGINLPPLLSQKKLSSYITNELKKLEAKGWWYPKAYSYYVLSRLGNKVSSSDIKKILDSDTGISEYAFAGLAAVELGYKDLSALAVKKLKNLMALTTRGASFQNSVPHSSWYFFNGNPERFALTLHLFTKVDPDDIYNGHLVWQLLELAKSGNGRWCSTALTSRVLIALDVYIRENKLQDTNLTASALIDGKEILSGKFKGLGAEPVDETYRFGKPAANMKQKDEKYSLDLPNLDVSLETELPLEIRKDGSGKLFYTASMTYALPAEEQTARDEGLCVYVEITDARTGEKIAPGKLKSGTIYREKVYVTTTKERTYVAVRAPVPAGAEILNSAFVTTASVPSPESRETTSKYIWKPWRRLSHQDIYDAEIRCFWDYLPIGSQNFEFLFRAQRNGEYETPATLAECMYEPEIFGRSNGAVWKIE